MKSKEKKIMHFVNIIIIFIFILSLLFIIKKMDSSNRPITTGNIDIFNIECDDSDGKEDNCISNNVDINNDKVEGIFKEDDKILSEERYEMKDFNVFDEGKTWDSKNELRIFSNSAYEFDGIIAPGTSNVYQFVVNNNNRFNIKYAIDFIETNEHSINMKYKLKRNGEYIFGNSKTWVSADKIKKEGLLLDSKSHDSYQLEWEWIDSDNDAEVAFKEANYSLEIKISAESI